ncbi:retrovirus-related pol polyprotein from transposon TNT 1-94 [Tanacetum coccineum]
MLNKKLQTDHWNEMCYQLLKLVTKQVMNPGNDSSVIDDEEPLILEEESRSKMSEKAKDPEVINKNISHKPIDYEKLNRLTEDFGKRFTPQQELSAEQAFWLRMSDPTSKPSDALPVKIEAPKELPKISLVNESLKKLKFHLAKFDNVVKIRTTPNARTEGEWGFEHTKAVFNNEIIPFLKSLKDIFNMFDRDLLNEIMEVFKEQFDLIKKTCVRSKEQSDSLNDKLNLKSAENKDLKAQLQDKECSSLILNLWPLGLKCSTSKCGSKPTGNKRNDRISQTPSRNMKNKVEAQPRKVNKKNCVVKIVHDVDVKHSVLNTNSEPICATCYPDFRFKNDNIARNGDYQLGNVTILKVYYVEGLRHNLFSVGKFCDADLEVAFRKNTCFIRNLEGVDLLSGSRDTNLYIISLNDMLKTYLICLLSKASKTKSWLWHRRLSHLNFGSLNKLAKDSLARGSSKKAKIVESKTANHSEPNHTWGSNATDIPSSSSLVMIVRFRNDNIARIMGYGDYQLGNVTILKVYYVEGLRHNLFSVGKFCDADLEVAFRKNTCFIRNLEGVDLLSGSRDTNLYTISLNDMLKTYLICLLSKASKTKSWLWHRRLSHLNFGTLNKLAKDSLARVIVDDYSRFTWVIFLRTKDEAPEAIIKYIKNIQVRLNATVRNVQTDNGTEFVNQTLREFYENVGISHQTSVARTPQQNRVVERRN